MPMILTFALVGIAGSVLLLNSEYGILLTVLFKPIIDTSWKQNLFGVNALEVVGVLVPVVLLAKTALFRARSLIDAPAVWAWWVYLLSNLVGAVVILASGRSIDSIEHFTRTVSGFAGYLMFQVYFNDRKQFRKLIWAILLAGLFPVAMGLYQAATGRIWQLRQTVGLVRNVGMYHDAFSLRAYGFMTLTGILLYWSCFARSTWQKALLLVYGLAACFVIYKVYSKAAMVIVIGWVVIWSILYRKPFVLVAFIVGVLFLSVATRGNFVRQVTTVFSKEIAVVDQTGDPKRALAGRAFVWENALAAWQRADIVGKTFGVGYSGGGSHNDYIRVLVGGGIFGLFVYLILLTAVGWKTVRVALSRPEPINVMALMILMMYLVDTIGLTPGIYPGYQWYVWGFIGLALRGVDGLTDGRPQDAMSWNLSEDGGNTVGV